ncbi:MAG: alpha/beta fold hydrolase [Mariprofundaceae bacterium]
MSLMHHHEKIFIDGPVGPLQALYQPGQLGLPAVVICHPHPVYGGTMRNKVVYWMGRVFEDLGYSVLRFNFRGVEQSAGVWSEAVGEIDDVSAAVDYMQAKNPGSALWLAGFSFGSYAGLKAVRQDGRIERMFAVAPAVSLWSFDFMQGDLRPLTVISGMDDEIVPFEQVEHWVKSMPKHVKFHAIEGAGHFFPQHMQHMQQCLLDDI